jgi:hypothetical protein
MWQTFTSVLDASWRELGAQLARGLPNLLAGLVIFLVGVAGGVAAGAIARRALVAARLDRGAARLGIAEPLARVGIASPARLIAQALKWGIIAVAFLPALYTLDPRVASDLVGRSLLYLPHLAIAIALLWIGSLLSGFLARGVLIAAVNHEIGSPRLLAAATRIGVMLLTVAVALEQSGIGRATVLTAFAILFGGITLAAALAVGLGSREIVRDWLARHARSESSSREQEPFQHW